jgi:prepilin-type N-terminal cleavage/methylation domain-containing protein
MKKNGFTLVELLTVIFIIALISGISYINFGDIRDQLALKRAVYQLAQDLRRAQEMAMSATKLEGCQLAKGYGIYIDRIANSKNYTLYGDVNGDENYSSGNDCIIKSIVIQEKGVVIKQINNTASANTVSINFKPPNPDTKINTLNTGQNTAEIVLALGSKTKIVVVNTIGMIGVK